VLVGLDPSSLDRSSLFSLQGKVALLTGASGFLGRTFAETLLANGADLIAIGRPAKLSNRSKFGLRNTDRVVCIAITRICTTWKH
jgi:NAD(P)-dependent dehydrogenase (short-subunit alcohol dehydrogenase family)